MKRFASSFAAWLHRSRKPVVTALPNSWPAGPGPAVLEALTGQVNPVLQLLDEWHLPRHETRAQVVERSGLSTHPFYEGKTIMLSEATALPGAMAPWTTSALSHSATVPHQPLFGARLVFSMLIPMCNER